LPVNVKPPGLPLFVLKGLGPGSLFYLFPTRRRNPGAIAGAYRLTPAKYWTYDTVTATLGPANSKFPSQREDVTMARWNNFDRGLSQGTAPEYRPELRQMGTCKSAPVAQPGTRARLTMPGSEAARSPLQKQKRDSSEFRNRGRERSPHALRGLERQTLIDIGRFRSIDVEDLVRFVYHGDSDRMKFNIAKLSRQGLVVEKQVLRVRKSPRRIVGLSEGGYRLVRRIPGLPANQRIYHGLDRQKEIEHDADLYKIYQNSLQEIQGRDGRNIRVRLDFELKESVQHTKQLSKELPEDLRRTWVAAVAAEHGLSVRGDRVHIPDLQIEYLTRDRKTQRTNLELVSKNYRVSRIRARAQSRLTVDEGGSDPFRIYSALPDGRVLERILAI
jgi:hypothetical protein